MANCLYCDKPVGLSKKAGKPRKVHGDRVDKESCAYKYLIAQNKMRMRQSRTKKKRTRDEGLTARGYVARDNFNDSFGV